ncbi:hypothetical protein GW17_00011656 [Ensete ventricosum]|nr:hypothetical protein GW17_00011656 [Ensete ventricosum]RZR78617.1 hypothetical protein BHM03_00004034 [Ensete ventricosum]
MLPIGSAGPRSGKGRKLEYSGGGGSTPRNPAGDWLMETAASGPPPTIRCCVNGGKATTLSGHGAGTDRGAPVSLCTSWRKSRGSTRYTLGGGGGWSGLLRGFPCGFCTAWSAARYGGALPCEAGAGGAACRD